MLHVIYHADCNDGFACAHIIHNIKNFKEVLYYPMNYGDDIKLTNPQPGDSIFILDFSLPVHVLNHLASIVTNILLIDHHQTAHDLYNGQVFPVNVELVLVKDKAACIAVWEWFHPHEPVPNFYTFIGDGDIWAFKNPLTKPFIAALNSYSKDFNNWDYIFNNKTIEEMTVIGERILAYEQQLINFVLSTEHRIMLPNLKEYMAVNCGTKTIISRVGHELAKKHGFGICYWRDKNKIIYSVRTEGENDAAKFCEQFGGGGHKHAAGFTLTA